MPWTDNLETKTFKWHILLFSMLIISVKFDENLTKKKKNVYIQ